MSRHICAAAIRGAHTIVSRAESLYRTALAEKGGDTPVEFPGTAYYLPVIYALLGLKVKKLADAELPLRRARALLPPEPTESLWLPYLGPALDAGAATLVAEEIIEALKFTTGPNPAQGIWLGATTDAVLRKLPLRRA